MIRYQDDIYRQIKKRRLSKELFFHFNNAFISLETIKDFALFDIKQLKTPPDSERIYYRLRKGKYRAVFYMVKKNIFVLTIDKREDL